MDRLLPSATIEICVFCGGVYYYSSTTDDADCVAPVNHIGVSTEIEGLYIETDVCSKDPDIQLIL